MLLKGALFYFVRKEEIENEFLILLLNHQEFKKYHELVFKQGKTILIQGQRILLLRGESSENGNCLDLIVYNVTRNAVVIYNGCK
ncbi:hypothetical protein CN601_08065 [Bacillus sp. AFS017336]|nr:hypothetical protein CN601_08065 [Bacillus sp. AFS017336]